MDLAIRQLGKTITVMLDGIEVGEGRISFKADEATMIFDVFRTDIVKAIIALEVIDRLRNVYDPPRFDLTMKQTEAGIR